MTAGRLVCALFLAPSAVLPSQMANLEKNGQVGNRRRFERLTRTHPFQSFFQPPFELDAHLASFQVMSGTVHWILVEDVEDFSCQAGQGMLVVGDRVASRSQNN